MMLTLLVVCLQDSAADTYRAMEKKFVDAPGVTIALKGESTVKKGERTIESKITGRVVVKPGDKAFYELTLKQGDKSSTITSKSDGKTTINSRDGVAGKEAPIQKRATEFLRECVLRTGFIPLTVAANAAGSIATGDLPAPDDACALSNFSSPEKGVIEYDVKLFGKMDGKVKLWIADGLPVRRTFTSTYNGAEITITETYEKVSLADVPDAEFKHE
jgi:hypothetical protein